MRSGDFGLPKQVAEFAMLFESIVHWQREFNVRKRQPMNQQKHFQFSIAWLLILMTIAAVIIAKFPQSAPVLLVVFAFIILCNFAAISVQKEGALYYWQTTLAYVLLLPAASLGHSFNSHIIGGEIFLATGFTLSLVPIVRSNWAVRIYALPALGSYCFLIYRLLTHPDVQFFIGG